MKRFWDHNSPHQDLYNSLYTKLVPASGKAPTEHGNLLRCMSKLYYDYYNNGGGNINDGALREHCEVLRANAKNLSEINHERIEELCDCDINERDLELLINAVVRYVAKIEKGLQA
jgi:hypothetical protein